MGWNARERGRYEHYEQYKEDYRNLQKVFNPVKFNPEKWVKAAQDAGMRYMVFTTKHHDGFCMFDTKTTDFKITSHVSPFHEHPRANVTRQLFDTFRNAGFWIGAYFSKADWDCDYYWWPYFATPDRHVNYDPGKYPERWEKFKEFTYRQIEELMTEYGRVDVLWLDGGWVRPYDNIPKKFERWAKKEGRNQDINMDEIADMARTHQPGLIIVDRTVGGKYENIITPEGRIPGEEIRVPWETCMTMAKSGWSHRLNQEFIPVHNLIHILVNIVSKGGNLLLNIGPDSQGDWPEGAYDRLQGISDWMKINSEAIYATRSIKPYKEGKVCLTRKKGSDTIYATYLADEDEESPPAKIWLSTLRPSDKAKITMLGVEGELKWEKVGKGFVVDIPERIQNSPPCRHAWTIKISQIEEK
jgi:alpha-L-fucosidase